MVSDYIYREAAIEAMYKDAEANPNHTFWTSQFEALMGIPAADVRNVVLCRDCLHYEMGVCLKIYDDGAANKDAWQERKPDDYCSYGEGRNVPTNCRTGMRPTSIKTVDYWMPKKSALPEPPKEETHGD